MFLQTFLISTLLTITLGSPSDDPSSDHDLRPWLLPKVDTFSPSGRPGSSPFDTINITIIDPNTITSGPVTFPPITANCSAQFEWNYAGGTDPPNALPWGVVQHCQPVRDGVWTFKILKPHANETHSYPSPTSNFRLEFTLVRSKPPSYGRRHSRKYIGAAHFEIFDGVLSGVCGGSGVCGWHLKEDDTPFVLRQAEVSREGEGGDIEKHD